MKDLRDHVLFLLTGEGAHAGFESAVKDLPREMRGTRPKGADHSPWELLEHLRIGQWDILEYVRDPKHVSPAWPSGYWPKTPAPPSDRAWDESVNAFRRDLQAIAGIVKHEKTDLLAPIPHAKEHTILREALLAADHNAYHLGQLVLTRKLLDAWG